MATGATSGAEAAGRIAFPPRLAELRLPEHMFRSADGVAVAYDHPSIVEGLLDPAGSSLDVPAGPALVRAVPQPTRPRWLGPVALSVAFHLAVAGAFLILPQGEEVLIEGGAASDVAALGNAEADQMMQGDAVDVEIMEMASLAPEPVATETLESVTSVETLTAAPVESLSPVVAPERLAAAEPVEQAVTAEPAERLEAVELEPTPAVEPEAVAAPTPPDVLAVARLAPPEALDAVPPVTEALQPAETAEQAQPTPPEVAAVAEPQRVQPAEADAAKPVASEAARPVEAAMMRPVEPDAVITPVEPEPTLPPDPVLAENVDVTPTPRPEQQAKPEPTKTAEAVAKPEPKKAAPERPARQKPVEKAEARKAEPRRAAGSGGANRSDAARGDSRGTADGRAAASKGGATRSAAGNAAVSNYPGKVVSKLRRSLPRRVGERGEVQVGFTVSRSGSVSAIRILRSSGSPTLDRTAMDTVRRAAPFPPIPADAGRSSWAFNLPLSFRR